MLGSQVSPALSELPLESHCIRVCPSQLVWLGSHSVQASSVREQMSPRIEQSSMSCHSLPLSPSTHCSSSGAQRRAPKVHTGFTVAGGGLSQRVPESYPHPASSRPQTAARMLAGTQRARGSVSRVEHIGRVRGPAALSSIAIAQGAVSKVFDARGAHRDRKRTRDQPEVGGD